MIIVISWLACMYRDNQSDRLPVHCEPKDDEVFSSWVCRTSLEHGLPLNTFNRIVFENHIISKRDIDKYLDDSVWKRMADVTGVDYRKAQNTVLLRKLHRVVVISENMTNAPWVTHASNIYSTRSTYGNCFCPECFAGDKDPYLRLAWRVAFVTVCPKHRCLLHDRCSNCGASINLYRLEPESGQIHVCHNCDFDLSTAPMKSYPVSDDQVEMQNILLSLLDHPKVSMPDGNTVFTSCFFQFLHEIAYMASKIKALIPAVRRALCFVYGSKWEPSRLRHENFEAYPPEERFVFLNFAYSILRVWPCNFNYECMQRFRTGKKRTYPLTYFPCEKWCAANKNFHFVDQTCGKGIKQLQYASPELLRQKKLTLRGIKPRPLQT